MQKKDRNRSIFFNLDNFFATLLVILVLKFLPIIFTLDFLDPIQNTIEDFQLTDIVFNKLRDNDKLPVDTNIVLVNISKLDRAELARQIEVLNIYEPKVIGLDCFLKDLKDPVGDSLLASALAKVKNLVLVSKLENPNLVTKSWDSVVYSNEIFTKNSQAAYANFIINEDFFRTVRIFTPRQTLDGQLTNAFAVQIARIYDPRKTHAFIERNNETEIINFRGNTDKFYALDYKPFFRDTHDFSFIRGKIVLMGFIGPNINELTNEDIFFTPMNPQYVGKGYPDMYGVVVWANIVSMILSGDFYNQISPALSQVLTFIILYICMVIYTFMRKKFASFYEAISIALTFGLMILIAVVTLWIFFFFKLELKFEGLFFGILVSKQLYETWVDSLKLLFLDFVKNRVNLKPIMKNVE